MSDYPTIKPPSSYPSVDLVAQHSDLKFLNEQMRTYLQGGYADAEYEIPLGKYGDSGVLIRSSSMFVEGIAKEDNRYRELRHSLLFDGFCEDGEADEEEVPISHVRPIRKRRDVDDEPITGIFKKGDNDDSIACDDRAVG